MLRFVLRRFLQMIPLLLGVSFISFAVMKMAPGDFLTQMRANPQISPEAIERLRRDFGLDRPWLLQYWFWLYYNVKNLTCPSGVSCDMAFDLSKNSAP